MTDLRMPDPLSTDEPLVHIVILNWNNPADTLICLESVHELDYSTFHIVVVDNGSTDDSVTRIREAWPSVEILETHINLGYAEGNNVGIRHALAQGADHILILNNDVILAPSMLSELVRVLDSKSDVGMVGPKLYCSDSPNRLFATGSFVDWRRGSLEHRNMFQYERRTKTGSELPESVEFLIGCVLLIRRQAIEVVGGFNSKYYLNFEDVEMAIRLISCGYRVQYVPTAHAWHKISATLGQASAANTYYMTRNALLFFSTNGRRYRRWLTVSHIFFQTVRTIAAWSLKAQYDHPSYRSRRVASVYAICDYLLGRYGAMSLAAARACQEV